jgi:hypothetical protein
MKKILTLIFVFAVAILCAQRTVIMPHYEVDKDSQGNVYYAGSPEGGTYLPFFTNIISRTVINKMKYTGVTHYPTNEYRVSMFLSAGLEQYFFLVNTEKKGGIRDRLYKISATYLGDQDGNTLNVEYVLESNKSTDVEFGWYPNLPDVLLFTVQYELYEMNTISGTKIKFVKQ